MYNILAFRFLSLDASYRLDAMNLAWGSLVVLTPFIPACYTAHLLFTHLRELILQNRGVLCCDTEHTYSLALAVPMDLCGVLMIFVWQKELGEGQIVLMDWKTYMGRGKRHMRNERLQITNLKVNYKALLKLMINCQKFTEIATTIR